jgi:hypothetical protein
MKKHFFILGLLFFSLSLSAQIINIPDSGFKSKLINMQVPSVSGDYAENLNGDDCFKTQPFDGKHQ